MIVLLFGNRRLPELGSALGKGLHAFKKGLEGKSATDEQANEKIAQSDKPETQRLT